MKSVHHSIESKFSIPKIPEQLIPRPHLLHLLHDYKKKRMTLVSSPPGYGKTIAIAQWVETLVNAKTAWISLDTNDDNPSLFFHYLIDAFNKLFPDSFSAIRNYIESMPVLHSKEIIVRFISVLDTLSDTVVLIFDDYHVIEDVSIHEALHFFIKHKPETVHVCLVSRNDPPMPLRRFRVNDEMIEIRKHQLKFSKNEMKLFFKNFNSVSGNENDLKLVRCKKRLLSRTFSLFASK